MEHHHMVDVCHMASTSYRGNLCFCSGFRAVDGMHCQCVIPNALTNDPPSILEYTSSYMHMGKASHF
eukprot:13114518-Ditylum_brightwellii.AAC.1